MLVMPHPRGGRVDPDMPDVKAGRDIPREPVIAKHDHALQYCMAVTGGFAVGEHHCRALRIFRDGSRWRNIAYPLQQQVTLCQDLRHHATSLRSSTGQGALIVSTHLAGSVIHREQRCAGTLPPLKATV